MDSRQFLVAIRIKHGTSKMPEVAKVKCNIGEHAFIHPWRLGQRLSDGQYKKNQHDATSAQPRCARSAHNGPSFWSVRDGPRRVRGTHSADIARKRTRSSLIVAPGRRPLGRSTATAQAPLPRWTRPNPATRSESRAELGLRKREGAASTSLPFHRDFALPICKPLDADFHVALVDEAGKLFAPLQQNQVTFFGKEFVQTEGIELACACPRGRDRRGTGLPQGRGIHGSG